MKAVVSTPTHDTETFAGKCGTRYKLDDVSVVSGHRLSSDSRGAQFLIDSLFFSVSSVS